MFADLLDHFQPRSPTAITASVRLLTLSVLRMAVTWFLTVGSARLSARHIALLLLPFIKSPKISPCRGVRPRSAGFTGVESSVVHVGLALESEVSSRSRISRGM